MRKLIPLLLALALVAGCAKQKAASSGTAKAAGQRARTVTVFMWSEYIDPALVERFEKETGLAFSGFNEDTSADSLSDVE